MTQSTSSAERRAWVALGGLHLLDGSRPRAREEAIVLVPVSPVEDAVASNTIVLAWDAIGPTQVTAVRGSKCAGMHIDSGADLFDEMLPAQTLQSLVTHVGGDPAVALVPLCYLSGVETADGLALHVYAQVRFLHDDACYIRVTGQSLAVDSAESLSWLDTAVSKHAEHALFLHNHQCYYRRLFPGQELEYKYRISPQADIWNLTVELQRQLKAGSLPGFVMEYRDEFQAWDYLNHLFEIPGPSAEQGYVSFLPTTDGRYTIKRKWFGEDAYLRGETHTKGVDVTEAELDGYVRERMGLEGRRLPSFRRVRYDVNFESVRTGHVYGIFFDHCTVLDSPDDVLRQCELEYLRSRTLVSTDEGEVRDELDTIAEWLEHYLAEQGEPAERYSYSKLSFLRDVVARRQSQEVC